MSAPKVDVLAVLDAEITDLSQTSDAEEVREYVIRKREVVLREARAAVAELIEAAKQAKRAYWLARNSAAGLTNFCEESASSRRCERELSEAESIWNSAGLDAALANIGPQS